MSGESQKEPVSRPDPTVLTTEQVIRETSHLQEKLEGIIALGLANLETRMAGEVAAQREQLRRVESMLEERDRRYAERFIAQQTAVDAAFAAREEAVESAFRAAEKAVDAAFKSSQEAVNKAEISIEKRADSTYVTLNDLQRQLQSLMPRSESEQRLAATQDAIHRVERISAGTLTREEYTSRHLSLQEGLANLASRMDKQEGYSGGANIDRSLQALRAQVDASTHSIADTQGQKAGVAEQRALMFAFAGFVVTLLTIAGVVAAIWPS